MRHIEHIVVHCTATSQKATVETIRRGWKERGWRDPGYHYIIPADGEIVPLLDEERIANGAKGHNKTAIHVAYVGGIDGEGKAADNRTPEQRASLWFLLEQLRDRYPQAEVLGHRDLPGVCKDCPSFDAKTEYKSL